MLNRTRALYAAGLASLSMPVLAVNDYTGLTVDVAGIPAAAIAIATTMLGVLAVFWGVRKIMGLVG